MSDQTPPNESGSSEGLWLPIAELAELKGKTRQTVWEKVSRLEADGLLTTKRGQGGSRLVNVAEYDRAVNETTDFAREQAAETVRLNREADWGDTRLRDANRRKVEYEAALKSIELKKAVGALVEITQMNEVIAEVGEEIKKPLEQVLLRADEITAAASSGGAVAVRTKLREIIFAVRTEIAEALAHLDLRARGAAS